MIDYNKLMKEEIKQLTTKPKLLLHVCCAPCSSAVIERLNAFDLTLYYYNPNTFPNQEYELRANQFAKLTNIPTIVENYNHQEFLNVVVGFEEDLEGGERCKKCIELRLRKTFEFAKRNNYEYVTTSLTISPHKDCEFINTVGKLLEKEFGIKFLIADFKKENGFLNSINLSKKYDLYRQDYCGCEFSYKN